LRAFEAVNWTAAICSRPRSGRPRRDTGHGRGQDGNDPHNQELGICLLEDYAHSTAKDRDRLLLASASTPRHREVRRPLEAYRRFSEAFAVGA